MVQYLFSVSISHFPCALVQDYTTRSLPLTPEERTRPDFRRLSSSPGDVGRLAHPHDQSLEEYPVHAEGRNRLSVGSNTSSVSLAQKFVPLLWGAAAYGACRGRGEYCVWDPSTHWFMLSHTENMCMPFLGAWAGWWLLLMYCMALLCMTLSEYKENNLVLRVVHFCRQCSDIKEAV